MLRSRSYSTIQSRIRQMLLVSAGRKLSNVQCKDIVRELMKGVDGDHFLILNLLTFGECISSKRFPTLLWVEPVSAKVSTFPVKTFSLPILKSRQLSFLMPLSFLRAGFDEVSRGESDPIALLPPQSAGTVSNSSQSSPPSLKQPWLKASVAVILSRGLFFNIFLRRSSACSSSLSQTEDSKLKSLWRFCFKMSLYVFPGKTLYPRSKMWKMSPKLKISQIGSYLVLISLILMTQGATQPGVPHLTNRQLSESANSDRPKSAMTQSQLPGLLKIRFSGFRSRCMILFLCISWRPLRIENMICLTSQGLYCSLALILSQTRPPSRSQTTMQRELSDQKTSCRRMQFLWFRFLMISISLMRHSFPFSQLQAASLENALTAQLRPFSIFSARQTEAKLPFPIFFLGLNCSWNPRWFSLFFSISLHC